MVKIMESPIKMDDWGYHYFWKHPNEHGVWSKYFKQIIQLKMGSNQTLWMGAKEPRDDVLSH